MDIFCKIVNNELPSYTLLATLAELIVMFLFLAVNKYDVWVSS